MSVVNRQKLKEALRAIDLAEREAAYRAEIEAVEATYRAEREAEDPNLWGTQWDHPEYNDIPF